MNPIRSVKSPIAAASLALVLGAAQATPVTFDLSYSGSAFNNNAVATGFITMDSAYFTQVTSDSNVAPSALGITNFQITVSNAPTGDGTFGLGDFAAQPDGWILVVSQPPNLAVDLVGQAGFMDFNWCASTSACGNSKAPGGVEPFGIKTNGETGAELSLTSMVIATVPEPNSLALLGLALAGLGLARRRKS